MSSALCLVLLYWRAAGTGVWLTAGSRGSRQLRNDTAVTTQSRNGLVVTSVVEMRSEDTNLKYIQGSSKEEREDIRRRYSRIYRNSYLHVTQGDE